MAVIETLSMQSASVKQGNVLSKLNEFHDSAMLSVEGQKRMGDWGMEEQHLVTLISLFEFCARTCTVLVPIFIVHFVG